MEDKSKRYDRQIRIWGEHGQTQLENTQVCLLNCGPTGSETLKNLVLGGIASFTAVDAATVEPADLGTNFMLDADSLGQPKAKCVCGHLKELNESVNGSFVDEKPETLIESNPSFFTSFTLIIATQLGEASLLKLDELCRRSNIPLIIARSYGLMGYLRVCSDEHCVVETKPDNKVEDLRLGTPWPELEKFVMDFDMDSLDDKTYKHVPWAIILVQAARKWKDEHGGNLPSSYKERNELKAQIRGIRRSLDEENFDEALSNAHWIWALPTIGSEVRTVLESPKTEVDSSSSDFWVLAAALKNFYTATGNMPLEGSVPDMTSTTEFYLEIQRLYREKADADIAAVTVQLKEILREIGRPSDAIPPEDIKAFCKNARNLQVVWNTKLSEECEGSAAVGAELSRLMGLEDSGANAALYVLLRAADRFNATHGRFPGVFDSELNEDASTLKAVAMQILADQGVANMSMPDDLVAEMCRFGAAELHCVAAIMGGAAAQEAIKIITRQFVPLHSPLIFNAMSSNTTLINI